MLTTEPPSNHRALRPDALDRMDRATFRAWCATLASARLLRWSEIADAHTAAVAESNATCLAIDELATDDPTVIFATFEAAHRAGDKLAAAEADLAAERAALSPDAAAFLRSLPTIN